MSGPLCILCGADGVARLKTIQYSDVWSELESDFEVEVPTTLRASLTPGETCDLYRCVRCELEFFEPAVPASPDYYALLARSGRYYEVERWEFFEVARDLAGTETVVDFASGAGRFSELAAERGCSVISVDTNPRASSRHPRVEVRLEVPPHVAGRLDMFCGFQVVEHVPDPAGFARMARDLVRPGGRIALSVPNRHRVGRKAMEPLDHPPHHLTRWTSRTLQALGEVAEVHLEHLRFERPIASDVRTRLASRLPANVRPRSARLIGRAAYPTVFDAALGRLRAHGRVHLYGHTMLAIYRRPS